MDDATWSGAPDQDPNQDSTSQATPAKRAMGLTQEVRSLRDELTALRESLTAEVRTRQLVVVEDDGFERCVVRTADDHATLLLGARSPKNNSTAVELYVHDAIDGDGPIVGMALLDQGNVVATFDLVSSRLPALWIDGETT